MIIPTDMPVYSCYDFIHVTKFYRINILSLQQGMETFYPGIVTR